jgi:hypothetical protein
MLLRYWEPTFTTEGSWWGILMMHSIALVPELMVALLIQERALPLQCPSFLRLLSVNFSPFSLT